MKDLQAIFKALNTSEINWIRHVLNYKNGNTKQNKKLLLFNLLVEQNNISDAKASQLIYKRKPGSAYSHLKKRLKEDIFKYVSSCPNHESSLNINESAPDIKCHELLVKIRWILDKGLNNQAKELIESALNFALKYELIPALVYLNEILLSHKLKPIGNVNNYLTEYIKIITLRVQIKNEMDKLSIHHQEEAPVNLKKTWYHFEVKTIRQEINLRNFDSALHKALTVLQQISKYTALDFPAMKAETGLLLAHIYICLSNSYQAEKYARFALKFLDKQQSDIAREILFFSYFRAPKISALEQLLTGEKDQNASKWSLYKAFFLHMQGKYKESISMLQNEKSVWGDKSTTVIGYKLLEIMNLLDLREYDWFELRLDTFRKLLKRFPISHYKRFHSVFYLLKKLSALSYQIEELVVHEVEIILALKEEREELYWNPLGPEVIRFENWLIKKLQNTRNLGYRNNFLLEGHKAIIN